MNELALHLAESALILLARSLLCVVPRLPRRALDRLARAFGAAAYLLAAESRRVCLRNLAVIRPDLPAREAARLVRAHMAHQFMNLFELMRSPARTSAKSLEGLVAVEGFAHLDEALARGRGVVLLVPHFGNWELLGETVARLGYPLHSFYLDLRFRRLGELLNDVRRGAGIRLIGRHELRRSVAALKDGHLLGVLADQDGGEGGILARLFGRPVSFPAGPVRLARLSGAAVVPCALFRREDGTYLLKAWPEIPMARGADKSADEAENARRMLAFYEALVRQRPEQWLLIYDRFKDRRHVRALLAGVAARPEMGTDDA